MSDADNWTFFLILSCGTIIRYHKFIELERDLVKLDINHDRVIIETYQDATVRAPENCDGEVYEPWLFWALHGAGNR
jgi:hypothetical protein